MNTRIINRSFWLLFTSAIWLNAQTNDLIDYNASYSIYTNSLYNQEMKLVLQSALITLVKKGRNLIFYYL